MGGERGCIFCDIVAGRAPASWVYKDALVIAFLDILPVTPGHLLVIPREHAARLADLPAKTGERMFRVGQTLSGELGKAEIKCAGVNLFLADGEAAGQEVLHAHLHVIPRFAGDGFGLKRSASSLKRPLREELQKIAGALRVKGSWSSSDPLRTHNVRLEDGNVVLRPMTEDDLPVMMEWVNEPPGDDDWSIEQVRDVYRVISYDAFNFVVEIDGKPAGDMYLQIMNLPHLIEKWPGRDLRRIDPTLVGWAQGKGIGTRAIGMLTRFGFEREKCEAVFGCSVDKDNLASIRAFQKNGYEIVDSDEDDYDLVIMKERFFGRK